MKRFFCLCLVLMALVPAKAFADMGDIQRVHSDIHAQVRGTNPPNEGRTGGSATVQRDVGHG